MLLRRGRLTVPELVRYLNASPVSIPGHLTPQRTELASKASSRLFPLRVVQQALIVLIQHHCVLHSKPTGDALSGEEYFEINQEEVLCRLRFGTYLSLAHAWGGDDAQDIVRVLLYHGQMRVADILSALTHSDETQVPDANRIARLRVLLVSMLQESVVRPSTPIQHVSPLDRQLTLELSLRKTQRGVPTAKSLREIKAKVESIINEEDHRDWEGSSIGDTDGLRLGLVRKASSDQNRDKRQKRRSNTDVSESRDDIDIDSNVWLRVHYDFFHLRLRNDIIVRAATSRYNSMTGEIMRYMLETDRPGTAPCEKDERSRPISVSSLAHRIPKDTRIQRGFDKRSIMAQYDTKRSATPSTSELLAEYVAVLTCNDNISSSVHSTRFLAPCSSGTVSGATTGTRVASTFTVEYVNIIRQLQLDMVRDVVVDRFGPIAGRIFSILVEKGKLEEKHISKIGLISMGETRDICSRLFAASILRLQEVPKSNERNPQRTFFLWYVDAVHCKSWLQDQLHRTLIQLSRRRLYEQSQKASLLRKSERTDVREDANSLLTDWERNELASLRTVEEAITVAEARVVRDTFVLQHFS